MKLLDLEGQFLRREAGPPVVLHYVDTLAEADGVIFLCPKCFAANGGKVGTHAVICWFEGKVPDDADPKPGRWNPSGTGLDDLTFVGPRAVSILLTSTGNPDGVGMKGGCGWHGFIRNGDAA